jgi:hypothetical protein
MAYRAGVTLAAVLFAAFLAPLAAGKGPIGATLEGPGLDAPIVFGGWSEDGAGGQGRFPLMPLVEAA